MLVAVIAWLGQRGFVSKICTSATATSPTDHEMCYKAHLMSPNAIRELRLRLGETQTQFGARFQVSQITVGYWENGRSQPARQRMSELAALASRALPVKPAVTPFRPIQYLGSKQRLAETVVKVINEMAPARSRVGDLFAGSSVVSALLGAERPVTAIDVQTYSNVLSEAVLLRTPGEFACLAGDEFLQQCGTISAELEKALAPLLAFEREAADKAANGNPDALIQLIEFGSIAVHDQRPLSGTPPRLGALLKEAIRALASIRLSPGALTATRYFGGPYFSYQQAIALDAIYVAAHPYPGAPQKIAALAPILSTASEIVNTVGKQFAQPMKLKKADGRVPPLLLQRALRDRSLDALSVFKEWSIRWQAHALGKNFEHRVVQDDVIDYLGSDQSCAVYYADPPYTIDHYSRFYHVLETLSLRDSPRLDEMKKRGEISVMRGIYRGGRYQSPFCIPSEAHAVFEKLFSAVGRRAVPLVMSYSPFDETEGHRPRLLSLMELMSTARRYFRHVSLLEIDEHSHRKLNAKASNTSIRSDAERLIICEGGH